MDVNTVDIRFQTQNRKNVTSSQVIPANAARYSSLPETARIRGGATPSNKRSAADMGEYEPAGGDMISPSHYATSRLPRKSS